MMHGATQLKRPSGRLATIEDIFFTIKEHPVTTYEVTTGLFHSRPYNAIIRKFCEKFIRLYLINGWSIVIDREQPILTDHGLLTPTEIAKYPNKYNVRPRAAILNKGQIEYSRVGSRGKAQPDFGYEVELNNNDYCIIADGWFLGAANGEKGQNQRAGVLEGLSAKAAKRSKRAKKAASKKTANSGGSGD